MGALEDSIPTGHDARFNGQTKYDVDCLPLSK